MRVFSFLVVLLFVLHVFAGKMSKADLGQSNMFHLMFVISDSDCATLHEDCYMGISLCMRISGKGNLCEVLESIPDERGWKERIQEGVGQWWTDKGKFTGTHLADIEDVWFNNNQEYGTWFRSFTLVVESGSGRSHVIIQSPDSWWTNPSLGYIGPRGGEFRPTIRTRWNWELPVVPQYPYDVEQVVGKAEVYAKTVRLHMLVGDNPPYAEDYQGSIGQLRINSRGLDHFREVTMCVATQLDMTNRYDDPTCGKTPGTDSNSGHSMQLNWLFNRAEVLDVNSIAEISMGNYPNGDGVKVVGFAVIIEAEVCATWGCSCQGFMDYYGMLPGSHWGCAKQEAAEWWEGKACGMGKPTVDLEVYPGCTEEGQSLGAQFYVPIIQRYETEDYFWWDNDGCKSQVWQEEPNGHPVKTTTCGVLHHMSKEWRGPAAGFAFGDTIAYWNRGGTGSQPSKKYAVTITYTSTVTDKDENTVKQSFMEGISTTIGMGVEKSTFGGLGPTYKFDFSATADFTATQESVIMSSVTKAMSEKAEYKCESSSPATATYSIMWMWNTYRKAAMKPEMSTTSSCDYIIKTGNCRHIEPNCIPGYCDDPECWECLSLEGEDNQIDKGPMPAAEWFVTSDQICDTTEDFSNTCDGTINDCLEKGEAACINDPNCFGVNVHEGWCASSFGYKLCRDGEGSSYNQNWTKYVYTPNCSPSLSDGQTEFHLHGGTAGKQWKKTFTLNQGLQGVEGANPYQLINHAEDGQMFGSTIGYWSLVGSGNAAKKFTVQLRFETTITDGTEAEAREYFAKGIDRLKGMDILDSSFGGQNAEMKYFTSAKRYFSKSQISKLTYMAEAGMEEDLQCTMSTPEGDSTIWAWTTYRKGHNSPEMGSAQSCDIIVKTGNCRYIAPNCLPNTCADAECTTCKSSNNENNQIDDSSMDSCTPEYEADQTDLYLTGVTGGIEWTHVFYRKEIGGLGATHKLGDPTSKLTYHIPEDDVFESSDAEADLKKAKKKLAKKKAEKKRLMKDEDLSAEEAALKAQATKEFMTEEDKASAAEEKKNLGEDKVDDKLSHMVNKRV